MTTRGRRRRWRGALLGAGVLAVLVGGVHLAAQSPPSPNPAFIDALWVGKTDGIRKLATATGATVYDVTDIVDVHRVAVDDQAGVVWAYGQGTLRRYAFDGTPLTTVTILPPALPPYTLAANPGNGTVWFGGGTTLAHYTETGALLGTVLVLGPILDLAVDRTTDRVWVATATSVQAYDNAGTPGATLALGSPGLVTALTVDQETGDVWVALLDRIRRYDPAGTLTLDVPLLGATHVASDDAGALWVATPTTLARLDATGQVTATVEPFPLPELPVALVADPADGSAWVASGQTLVHAASDGTVLLTLPSALPAVVRDLGLYADVEPPTLSLTAPSVGTTLATATPTIALSYSDDGIGVDATTIAATANGSPAPVSCVDLGTGATCTPTSGLPEGAVSLSVTVADHAGNESSPATVAFTVDTTPPTITLTTPTDGLATNVASQLFVGSLDEPGTLTLDGVAVTLDGSDAFSHGPETLVEGPNAFTLAATDLVGNQSQLSLTVTLDTVPPAAIPAAEVELGDLVGGVVSVTGRPGSAEPGAQVTITNPRTGASVTVTVAADGSFVASIAAEADDALVLVVQDAATNTSGATSVTVVDLPDDPAVVAPPVDPGVGSTVGSATSFLYTGSNPPQTGVAPGTIETHRAAVLRGTVTRRDGSPIAGAQVTVLSHPEYGQTHTRADGGYDLAVNGGGTLVLTVTRAGFLGAQRRITVPWQDFVDVEPIVLVPPAGAVTVIDLGASTPVQVAQGAAESDGDGLRRTTLLFFENTQATMVFADASTEALDTLSVRITEYTVGASGPAAMPASLPPTSGYTYAVELGVDEATAAGAVAVQFDQPVVQYVENFLGFPVGSDVPQGGYDRQAGTWVPSTSGRVVEIVSLTGGVADLDTDGDGTANDAATLAALGITAAEQTALANLYPSGQTLWRVPLTHFSTWDSNWGFGPPDDATFPPPLDPTAPPPMCTSTRAGSIIECETQVLGESLPVTGTPFSLNYRSDRALGRVAARHLAIRLSGSAIPASLKQIELEIRIAGQRIRETFPAAANQIYQFTWDNHDVYGRPLQGRHPIVIRRGFTYDGVYRRTSRFGRRGGDRITGSLTRREVTLWKTDTDYLGVWDARGYGLGGWTLDVHHAYDPWGELLLGSGTRRRAEALGGVMVTAAGTGIMGTTGDEGSATAARIGTPRGAAVAPDGAVYLSTGANVRRVDPTGIITTVAGIPGSQGYGGDGGPATLAPLHTVWGITALRAGGFCVADSGVMRIRCVDATGTIDTVAGTGAAGTVLEGAVATQSPIATPLRGLVAGPDDSLYFTSGRSVWQVDAAGILTRVAGTGACCYAGDGGPARDARLFVPQGLAIAEDGTLFIADTWGHRVRQVTPDGIITTVAGTGTAGTGGDGGPATLAQLKGPAGVAVAPDGTLYIAEESGSRVRRVSPSGTITTIAGTGVYGIGGELGPATKTMLRAPIDVALHPGTGSLYIPDNDNYRVRAVTNPLPRLPVGAFIVAAADGGIVHDFDGVGRHLATRDALTGATVYDFAYNGDGQLTAVTDRSGNVTTIERDGDGTPTAIVAPGGQRTALTLTADGYLETLANPAAETYTFGYTALGLLESLETPRTHEYTFAYDPLGYLTQDDDPAGGRQTLGRSEDPESALVTLTTLLGRVTTYLVERLTNQSTRQVVTAPSGHQTVQVETADRTRTVDTPDGTQVTTAVGPDPRFGLLAPVAESVVLQTPGNLTYTASAARTASLSDPTDLFSLTSATTTLTVNGNTATRTYDAGTRIVTDTSPEGRQRTRTLDSLGRLVATQVATLAPANFSYDPTGLLDAVTYGTGGGVRTYLLGYDAKRRLTSVTDPLSRVLQFEYDDADRVTKQILPDTREILFGYDANGNLASLTPPGRPGHVFQYTPVDLEAQYAPPDVGAGTNDTVYTYSADRELELVTRPDGLTIDPTYDSAGRLATITTAEGVTTVGYDSATGNLTSIGTPAGETLTYGYDGSLLTSTAWSGTVTGSVGLTYTADLQVETTNVNGGQSVTRTYDDDGLLTQAGALSLTPDAQTGFPAGSSLGLVTDAIGYNTFGDRTSYEAQINGAPLLTLGYTPDVLGRIETRTESLSGGATDTYVYGYDQAGRLETVTRNSTVIATYAYDANGNRLSRTTPGGTETATYDDQDRLLTYDGAMYTYTANGELATKTIGAQTTTYTYDVFGNLRSVALPSGTLIEYVVDGQHRRIGRKVNGVLTTAWLYEDQLRPLAELDGSGNVVASFVYGDGINVPAYMEKGGVTYRIITDHLGSPRFVVDTATGIVAQELAYDEFGRVTRDTNPAFQPFGFAGGMYDAATDLLRFDARDYDPRTGRWTAKDPIGFDGGANFYGYVANDPVNLLDPYGLRPGLQLLEPAGHVVAEFVLSASGRTYSGTAVITSRGTVTIQGVTFDENGFAIGEVGLESPHPLLDPTAYIVAFSAYTCSPSGLASRIFGKSGVLNSNRYLRVGFGRKGGELYFRIGGRWLHRYTGRRKIDLFKIRDL